MHWRLIKPRMPPVIVSPNSVAVSLKLFRSRQHPFKQKPALSRRLVSEAPLAVLVPSSLTNARLSTPFRQNLITPYFYRLPLDPLKRRPNILPVRPLLSPRLVRQSYRSWKGLPGLLRQNVSRLLRVNPL